MAQSGMGGRCGRGLSIVQWNIPVLSMCVHMYVGLYVCMCVCLCVCMYCIYTACVYVCVFTHNVWHHSFRFFL